MPKLYQFLFLISSEIKVIATKNKCEVCDEPAGKHCYYGGKVCPSCRAFFRRAVQNQYYEIFVCIKSKNCEINLFTRKSCQYCRFQKCLNAGMKVSWVLPDGERNRRFNKLIKNGIQNNQRQDMTPGKKKLGPYIKDVINQGGEGFSKR